jgi:hypothetical protein
MTAEKREVGGGELASFSAPPHAPQDSRPVPDYTRGGCNG